MSLQKQIDEDVKQAMRDKDSTKLGTLRMLKSSLKNTAIDKGGADKPLNDQDVQGVVRKEVKKREDSINSYQKAGRDDLVAKEQAEKEVLNAYLPPPMSESDVETLVAEAMAEASQDGKAPKMGDIMKAATAKAAGRVDGRTLSQAVQKQLNK